MAEHEVAAEIRDYEDAALACNHAIDALDTLLRLAEERLLSPAYCAALRELADQAKQTAGDMTDELRLRRHIFQLLQARATPAPITVVDATPFVALEAAPGEADVA